MKLLRKMLTGLCLVMCIMSVDVSVYAKNNEVFYSRLDEIPEDLQTFKTIAKGDIKAIEKDGEWYYRFRRKTYQDVLIKVSAFMEQPKNKYLERDNASLNNSLAEDSNHPYNRICYYIAMRRENYGNYFRYNTSINRINLIVSGSHSEFTTRCDMTHCVNFIYDTKIPNVQSVDKKYSAKELQNPDFWMKPSTASEYEKALKRYQQSEPLIPQISVRVENTGDNNVYLQSYTSEGQGNASSDEKVLIDLFYAAIALGKDIAVKDYSSLAVDVLSLDLEGWKKETKKYNSGKDIYLSGNKKYVYKTVYKSPISLCYKGDWVNIDTKCNAHIEDAIFYVNFSFLSE